VVSAIGLQEAFITKGSRSQPGTTGGLGATTSPVERSSRPGASRPDAWPLSRPHQHLWKAVGAQIPDTNPTPSGHSPSACPNRTHNHPPEVSFSAGQSERDVRPLEAGTRRHGAHLQGWSLSSEPLSPHISHTSSAPDRVSQSQGPPAGRTGGQQITAHIHASPPANLEHAQ